jgi:hypothetical protein
MTMASLARSLAGPSKDCAAQALQQTELHQNLDNQHLTLLPHVQASTSMVGDAGTDQTVR